MRNRRLAVAALLLFTGFFTASSLAVPGAGGQWTYRDPGGSTVSLSVAVEGSVVTGILVTPSGRFSLKGESDGAAAVGQVLGSTAPVFFQIALHEGRLALSLMGADGQQEQYVFERAGRNAAAPPKSASKKGGPPLSPAGRHWDARLRGKRLTQLESYYSGPAYGGAVGGGYSNRRVLDLCAGGEFVYHGSSQLGASGAGVGAVAGGNAADTGRWRIIERQGQVGLALRLQSGERLEVLLQHQDGKTLLDGTRTYVTDDNRSC